MKAKHTIVKTVLVLAIAAVLVFSAVMAVNAVFSESEAVHITPSEIEDSTLAVGTHLIHLSALDDSIYEIAQKSAEESGQSNTYYKSELAGGAWFDITSASTLDDITTGGTPVDDSVIAALFFTHHTRSDGVTYDLRTGEAVDPRDIYDPYDLESLEELYPLKLQYDLIRESQSESEAGQKKIERIAQFFQTETHNDATNTVEQQMDALQNYYNVLNENDGGETEKAKVQQVLDALDASRRAEVFTILEAALDTYLQELSTMTDSHSQNEDGSEETEPAAAVDTSLQSAVSDSLNNVRTSLIEQQGKMLAEGTTTASRTEYRLCTQLVSDAQANNHAACDTDVAQLISLDNILNDVISDQEAENTLLNDSLIPDATAVYTSALAAGVNADYTAAQAQNAASALLNGIARENESVLNSYRNELENFITARTTRMGSQDAMSYIDDRLSLTESWIPTVPNDAFRTGADSSISSHIDFLTQLRRQLELASGGNEADALIAEKALLQQQMMSCLDENDLAGAQAIEDQIAALDEQLENALAGMDSSQIDGTLGSQVAQAGNAAMDAIENGDTNTVLNSINALDSLMQLDPSAAFPTAQQLHSALVQEKELSGNNTFDDALAALENSILENADAYNSAMSAKQTAEQLAAIADEFLQEHGASPGVATNAAGSGSGTGSGSGSGSGTGSGTGTGSGSGTGAGSGSGSGTGTGTSSGTNELSGLDSLSDEEATVVYLMALQSFYDQTGNLDARSQISSLALRQSGLGNPLVYFRINDGAAKYVPVTAVNYFTGMRYIWNRNLSTAVLASGADYYGFSLYSDKVTRGRDDESAEYMDRAAKEEGGIIHISAAYTEETFGVGAVYLSGTQYAVVYDESLMKLSQDLLTLFLSAAS